MKVTATLILFVLAVTAVGCLGVGGEEAVERRYYAPEVKRAGAARAALPGSHLQVETLRISPYCEGTELVYRIEDERWESDYYNLFFTQPEDLVTGALHRWFRASGAFEVVLDAEAIPTEQYAVEGNIAALHGDFRDSSRPVAVLELQIFLVHSPGTDHRLVFNENYREEIPLEDDTVSSLMRGYAGALASIFTRIEEDVIGAIRSDR